MTKRKAFFGLVALAALMGVGFAELFWQGGRGAPAERHPPAEAKGNGRATAMRIPPKPKGDDKAPASL